MQPDEPIPSPPPAPRKIDWRIFFAVLLAPPFLTALTAMLFRTTNQNISPGVAIFGGGAAGITCGIMLGLKLGTTTSAQAALSLLFSAIMAVVCITMSCIGCMVAGYQMSFH